jgi:hypothetical protein
VAGVYEKAVDRESAYEKLNARAAAPEAADNAAQGTPGSAGKADSEGGGLLGGLNDVLFGSTGPRGGRHDGLVQSMAKSAVAHHGLHRRPQEIIRGVLGSLFGGKKR